MLARVDVGIAVVAGAVVILQTLAGEFRELAVSVCVAM